jgi:hypothetical protein
MPPLPSRRTSPLTTHLFPPHPTHAPLQPTLADADADNDAGGATAAAACAPAAATNASSDVDNLTNLPSNGKKGRGGRRGSVGARLSGCLSRRGSVGDTDNMRRLQRRSSVGAEEDGKPGRCRTLGNMLNPSQVRKARITSTPLPTQRTRRGRREYAPVSAHPFLTYSRRFSLM